MAGVPNTDTFTLQDVVDVVNPTTDDLQDCFNDAEAYLFSQEFVGDKNNLLNFRDYGDDSWFVEYKDRTVKLYDIVGDYYSWILTYHRGSVNSISGGKNIGGTFLSPSKVRISPVAFIASFTLDNTQETIEYPAIPGLSLSSNWYNALTTTNISGVYYTGSKIGIFYFAAGVTTNENPLYPTIKLKNYPSPDTYWEGDSGAVGLWGAYPITIEEGIDMEIYRAIYTAETGVELVVGSDGNFSASIASGSSWITLNDTSGTGVETITFDIDENTSGLIRTGNILITTPHETFSLEIIQTPPL